MATLSGSRGRVRVVPRRGTSNKLTWREQVVAAVLWSLDRRYSGAAIWGRDVVSWLRAQPDGPDIPYATVNDILLRFEGPGREWLVGAYEQFTEYEARPQRKFVWLTEAGVEGTVRAIQQLRADDVHRPSWLPFPEALASGEELVTQPDGFARTLPAGGGLVSLEDATRSHRLRSVGGTG